MFIFYQENLKPQTSKFIQELSKIITLVSAFLVLFFALFYVIF